VVVKNDSNKATKAPASKAKTAKTAAGGAPVSGKVTTKKTAPAAKKASAAPPAKAAVKKNTAYAAAQSTVKAPPKKSAGKPVGKVAKAVVGGNKPPATPAKSKYKRISYKTDPESGRPIVPKGYRPGTDEEYMNPLQLEYFRQRLLQWRADLVEESKQTIENLKDEVRDVGDEAERATRETENSLELRTRDRYRKLIGKIDSTLKRVDSGDYGYSVDSGEEIGLDRLEARLTAERTIDEQERWEHRQRQMGD